MDGGSERLIVLSAGNTDAAGWNDYPTSNMTDAIHDPAQSWNALTVGGYTEKMTLDPAQWPGYTPLAPAGDLSPCSCTSMTWARWPFKPDIVMEAGNLATNGHDHPSDLQDLQLLTTAHDFLTRQALNTFADTSAAAALAARYAAMVQAKYPGPPPSVRGLLVHFAEWTPAMQARFRDGDGDIDYRNLLRCYGYGVPNLPRLFSSLSNSLTLVAESSLHPFFKEETNGDERLGPSTREMRVHPLPWPTDVLEGLGEAPVSMRVTLSYFIEPSPGARGRVPRFGINRMGCALLCGIRSKALGSSRNALTRGRAPWTTNRRASLIPAGNSDA